MQGAWSNPEGLTFSGGNLYVASQGNNAILQYSFSTGQYSTFVQSGMPAACPCPPVWPSDATATLYVASEGSSSILSYDGATGFFDQTFVSSGFGGLSTPAALAFEADGTLLVASGSVAGGNGAILDYDSGGNFLSTLVPYGSGGLVAPLDLAITAVPEPGSFTLSLIALAISKAPEDYHPQARRKQPPKCVPVSLRVIREPTLAVLVLARSWSNFDWARGCSATVGIGHHTAREPGWHRCGWATSSPHGTDCVRPDERILSHPDRGSKLPPQFRVGLHESVEREPPIETAWVGEYPGLRSCESGRKLTPFDFRQAKHGRQGVLPQESDRTGRITSHLGLKLEPSCLEFFRGDLIRPPGRPADDGGDAAAIFEQTTLVMRLEADIGETSEVQHSPEAIGWN